MNNCQIKDIRKKNHLFERKVDLQTVLNFVQNIRLLGFSSIQNTPSYFVRYFLVCLYDKAFIE